MSLVNNRLLHKESKRRVCKTEKNIELLNNLVRLKSGLGGKMLDSLTVTCITATAAMFAGRDGIPGEKDSTSYRQALNWL